MNGLHKFLGGVAVSVAMAASAFAQVTSTTNLGQLSSTPTSFGNTFNKSLDFSDVYTFSIAGNGSVGGYTNDASTFRAFIDFLAERLPQTLALAGLAILLSLVGLYFSSRAADQRRYQTTKELNALMKKTIQQAVRQEVKSYKKKGGSDLNMVEALLGNFNYSDMDNMHIDSDDDRKIPADLTIDSDEEVSV